ncbi:FAD:protein FMN transferase [Roseiconus nitratireducens]|uniref:FAD:protein FMN transferase n=1 Tax=Roseiconus nitratireducens TaxID=2605748 RepID=A0A5M6DIT4_9BACT|nr:FAD:protein FMN transferase [Roseiconus nitratireducens]KAA5545185.1 FAD:protein FMN transferase [Roseiconus nitratireducens]
MLTTVTHRAMATEFAVILAESEAHRVEAALESLELLDRIEADLSVYVADSEISRVNAHAAVEPVAVSADTFNLLETSQRWSERSGGAFDVTAGPLVRAWGFTQRRGKKPGDAEIQQARERVGYQKMQLDADQRTVRFSCPGMEVNLGAIGKGFALDRLTAELRRRGLGNFLIHGGGSSVIAHGGQSADRPGWAVGISHPTKPKRRLAGIRLIDQALSTSGSGKQYFHHRGRRYGHVIDPRTGYPAGDVLSLTAICDNATDAEACSTSYFVWGLEEIRAVAESDPDLPTLIAVRALGRQDGVEVIAMGDVVWVDPPEQIADP